MPQEVEQAQAIVQKITEFFVLYSFQVLAAVIILVAGFVLASWVSKLLLKVLEKRKMDVTLSHFLASIVKGLVIAFAAIIAMGKFGITIAPFVAALGAIAFGATYAVAGPLSNYGAGISIILGRPFVVGDTITVVEVSGVVEEVKLAATVLENEDGVKITIPNKHIVGEILHNSKHQRIIEETVGVAYDCDIDLAIEVIKQVLNAHENVSQEPEPQVGIQAFGDSSINIGYRCFVPTKQYFETLYAINREIFFALKAKQISIPFPQREVRLLQ